MNVELFAGPGGFSLGARLAGVADPTGYEWDDEACATARAAGHTRVRTDVAAVTDDQLAALRGRGVEGLIGSPPCQAWSRSGLRGARVDADRILAHLAHVAAAGTWSDYRPRDEAVPDLFGDHAVDQSVWADPRSPLVLEMVRWQLALDPEWIACEQVPEVLPFWQAWAAMLRGRGYSVWTGVLRAEQYGVPQTRERSFLIAARGRDVTAPTPTHARFVKGAAPAGDVRPWISQAAALGWATGRVGFPRANDRPDSAEQYRARDFRDVAEPAFTLTEKVRSWTRWDVHERRHRISVAEASVLQGFPADYPWVGSPSARYRQIGDAVPPPLAAAVIGAAAGT